MRFDCLASGELGARRERRSARAHRWADLLRQRRAASRPRRRSRSAADAHGLIELRLGGRVAVLGADELHLGVGDVGARLREVDLRACAELDEALDLREVPLLVGERSLRDLDERLLRARLKERGAHVEHRQSSSWRARFRCCASALACAARQRRRLPEVVDELAGGDAEVPKSEGVEARPLASAPATGARRARRRSSRSRAGRSRRGDLRKERRARLVGARIGRAALRWLAESCGWLAMRGCSRSWACCKVSDGGRAADGERSAGRCLGEQERSAP